MDKRLEATPEKSRPRLVRLCEKLNLSFKERRALTILYCLQCDIELDGLRVVVNEVGALAKICDMTIDEMLAFADSEGALVKQKYVYFSNLTLYQFGCFGFFIYW
jgi:hypothetical protein